MDILLGHSDVGYRVLLNNRIIVARHVDIVERDVKCIGFDYEINKGDTDKIELLKIPRKSARDKKVQ